MTSSSGQLFVAAAELDLANTLDCGQAFRWRRDQAGAWLGVIGDRVVRLRRRDDRATEYRCWPSDPTAEAALARYLRLEVDLPAVQGELVARDSRVSDAVDAFPGLRLLRQPAHEAIISFVCSPASNITRITRSIDLLARRYGRPLAEVDGVVYHALPDMATLASTAPGELMQTTGLGFRGESLRRVAAALLDRPPTWAEGLGDLGHQEARRQLMTLPAVGPKIADCVCLFGLGHDRAVPVDTHVWGLARELFGRRFARRSLTPAAYEDVQAAYQDRYGEWAGWAQQYLFHGRRRARVLPMPSDVRLLPDA